MGTPNEFEVSLTAHAQLPAGAVIAYQHGGGAGFESPLLRDPEEVKEDVLDEIVSIPRARDKYGVVLTGTLEEYDIQVDLAATRDLRKKMMERKRAGEWVIESASISAARSPTLQSSQARSSFSTKT